MSKSEENTNELESYGVWVKNTAQTPEDITDTQEKTEDSLDLPEFDNTDFSDMFKNDSDFETPEEKTSETTEENMFANGEELSNDSATDEVILHEYPEDDNVALNTEETETESFDIPEFSDDIAEESPAEAPVTEQFEEASVSENTEENVFEGISEIETENSSSSLDELEINTENVENDAAFEEISFDSIDEPKAEEAPKEEKAALAPGEEEISLDDFLEEGFSDDSVASGNNGYEPGKGPDAEKAAAPAPSADGTEDISLDDFMDSEDFGVEVTETSEPAATAEETVDEPPLDMDISFDDSADTIETEDNKVSDDFSDFTADDTEEFDSDTDTEENSSSEDETYVADSSSVSTEEVDLSDFGIDSDAEETPVTQNVEEKKAAETVVDYDLAIGDEDSLASAPVINEIKTDEEEKPVEAEPQPVQAAQPDPSTTSLLQQIVAELSGLKNDINKLKSEIDEVRERGSAPVQPPVAAEVPTESEEISIPEESAESEDISIPEASVETEDISIPETTEEAIVPEVEEVDQGGFFSGDEDETIALSADELTNIPIDSDSVIEAESEVPLEESFETESQDSLAESLAAPIEDEALAAEGEALPTEDEALPTEGEALPAEDSGSGFFTDDGDETIALSGDELTNIMNTSELSESDGEAEESVSEEPVVEDNIVEPEPFVSEETAVSEEEVQTEEIPEETIVEETFEEPVLSDTSIDDSVAPSEDITFDFEDKNLEEPDIENIHLDDMDNSELPEEISIPKEDDNFFVESTSSDFMDSINSVSEEQTEEISEPESDDTIEEAIAEEAPVTERAEADTVTFETTDTIFEEPAEKSEENDVEFDSPDTLFEEHFDTTDTILSDIEEAPAIQEEAPAIQEEVPAPQEAAPAPQEASQPEEAKEDNSLEDVFSEAASEAFNDVDTSFEPVEAEESEAAETEAAPEVSEIAAVTEAPEQASEEPVEDNEVPTVEKVISQSSEANIDSNFAEVDNLDTNITADNIDYLNSDKDAASKKASNEDLKRDIKSVLLYMDQLLENLPEEKIMEFAKSDEFVTYKKLFSELGLS